MHEPRSYKVRYHGPDILRGFACSAIVLFHILFMTQIHFSDKVVHIVDKFGIAVPFFFMISAFSIYYNYNDNLFTIQDIKKFWVRRFFRLAPLYYVFLLIMAVYAKLVFHGFQSALDYVSAITFTYPLIPKLEGGVVWASWSIGIEWIFYIMFPFILVFVSNRVICVIFLILFAYIHSLISDFSKDQMHYMNYINHFCFFLTGIFIAMSIDNINKIKLNKYVNFLLMLCLIFILCIYFKFNLNIYINSIYVYIVILGSCIYLSLLQLPALINNIFFRFLGTASYSIYMIHPVVVYTLFKINIYNYICNTYGFGVIGFIICSLMTLMIVYTMSFFSYKYIERPGMILGKRVY